MKAENKTLRKLARNYIAPAMIGLSALVGSGCSSYDATLPVSEATRVYIQDNYESELDKVSKEISRVKDDYIVALGQLDTMFNGALEDSRFDFIEQSRVYAKVRECKNLASTLEGLGVSPDSAVDGFAYGGSYDSLHKLLEKNISRLDLGTPNLEKSLRREGMNVTVDGHTNAFEKHLLFGTIAYGLMCLLAYYVTKQERQ